MSEEATPPVLPQAGDQFTSLRAFDKATRAAQKSLDPAVELIQGKERADTLILICKRGRRKPGRRRAGERKLEDWELCPFTLSATLDDDASPPAYIVHSYTPHHHLDQQICSSSPAQVIPPLPVVPAPAQAPTPNSMPPPRRRRSISTGPLRNEDGRFVSPEATRAKKGLSTSLLPFSIPLLPIRRRHRPPQASIESDEYSPMLADTGEYLAWKEVLGIETNEIPGAWLAPVPKGRELFKQWGWMPEGAEEEVQEQEQEQTMDQENQGFEVEDHEEEDVNYQPIEEQPDPSSDDVYQPQPKRRRKSTSRPPPVTYGLARPSTRSSLRGNTRGSSINASESPEMRRGFWAREDDDDEAEATLTPETPFMELGTGKRKRDHSSADEDASMTLLELSSGGAEPIGLGLDLGAPAVEDDTETETPAIVGTGYILRPVPKLPFPCACHLGSGRPHLRIDTAVSESAAVFASPQPITSDTATSQAQEATRSTVQQDSQAPGVHEAMIAAIELSLPPPPPPPPAPVEPTPPSALPKKERVFSLPYFKKRPSVARQQSTDSAATAEFHHSSPAVSEATSESRVLARAASPPPPLFRAESEYSDTAFERPAPLLFKPRRAPKLTSYKSYIAAKPALKVALASAANATISGKVEEEKQEDEKPAVSPVVDLLQQREEIKQLKARFYDGSESEIDPLYCSSDLDHKLASLRSLGHLFSSNPAYTTLLASHRPSRSRLPQPFLHVRDGSSSAPSPASARPLNPRLLVATSYLWGRDLTRAEMEWLEREEKGSWKLVEEMVVVREVNETWEKVGREMEEQEREKERERERERNDSPKRRYQHHSPPSGHGGGRKYGRGGGDSGGGRVWRKGAEPPRGGGWKPDPKGDRWAR